MQVLFLPMIYRGFFSGDGFCDWWSTKRVPDAIVFLNGLQVVVDEPVVNSVNRLSLFLTPIFFYSSLDGLIFSAESGPKVRFFNCPQAGIDMLSHSFFRLRGSDIHQDLFGDEGRMGRSRIAVIAMFFPVGHNWVGSELRRVGIWGRSGGENSEMRGSDIVNNKSNKEQEQQ